MKLGRWNSRTLSTLGLFNTKYSYYILQYMYYIVHVFGSTKLFSNLLNLVRARSVQRCLIGTVALNDWPRRKLFWYTFNVYSRPKFAKDSRSGLRSGRGCSDLRVTILICLVRIQIKIRTPPQHVSPLASPARVKSRYMVPARLQY
jgi:hypothetical protein